MLDVFGFEIGWAWIWLGAGLVILVLELSTGSLFLLWPGLAAILFAIVVFLAPDMSIALQIALYCALAGALTVAGQAYFKRRPASSSSERPLLNQRSKQLVGRRVSAIGPFENGYGSVRLDDGQWSARLEGGEGGDIAAGAPLLITDVEGARLVVARA